MTIEEVKRCMETGTLIECKNAFQRGESVRFLTNIGYEIHSAADEWLRKNPDSTEFLHPGLDGIERKIDCWNKSSGKQTIPFRDIELLISKYDLPIDERNDTEFVNDFALLLGAERSGS